MTKQEIIEMIQRAGFEAGERDTVWGINRVREKSPMTNTAKYACSIRFNLLYRAFFPLLLLSPFCFGQDPLPVINSKWTPSTRKVEKTQVPQTGPARQMTVDDSNIERTNREARSDHPQNPSDLTPDGRRAAIEKNEQEAEMPPGFDVKGYTYSATVRNTADKTVKVVYWEYRFAELADPKNVVRRQFLCSVNLKKGVEIELSAFMTLGPTDVVNVATLASSNEKRFDEKVRVNRIEYADDDIVQRGDWKLADVKNALDRATATRWGKEICRPLL